MLISTYYVNRLAGRIKNSESKLRRKRPCGSISVLSVHEYRVEARPNTATSGRVTAGVGSDLYNYATIEDKKYQSALQQRIRSPAIRLSSASADERGMNCCIPAQSKPIVR
jgi:hypothetical protein